MQEQENLENMIFDTSLTCDSDAFNKFDPAHDYLSTKSFSEPVNVDEIDSGRALQKILIQYTSRIRQLKDGLTSSHKENDHVVDEYLMQNLELINLNKSLEYKVKERTRELEVANVKLEVTNQNLKNANQLLEDQAHQLKELNEAKEALMHMIVHDMKNPLTAILGTLTLFNKNSFNLNPDIHELLLSAHRHGIKLLSMIEEILMISRMKTKEFKLKPERANLIDTLLYSIDLMKKTVVLKNLKFHFEPEWQTLTVQMDVQIIERVINNLLNNAIKYAPQNSEILLEVEPKSDSVTVSITNWGEPIPEEYHQKIFELFSRVKKEDTQFSGTGLGLAFSKLAIEAHSGTLEVISPVPPMEIGACFRFSLPLTTIDFPQVQTQSKSSNSD